MVLSYTMELSRKMFSITRLRMEANSNPLGFCKLLVRLKTICLFSLIYMNVCYFIVLIRYLDIFLHKYRGICERDCGSSGSSHHGPHEEPAAGKLRRLRSHAGLRQGVHFASPSERPLLPSRHPGQVWQGDPRDDRLPASGWRELQLASVPVRRGDHPRHLHRLSRR